MTLKLKTAPAEEPVTAQEWADHLRIVSNASIAADLASKLLAGRRAVERQARRAIVTSTWLLYLEGWPDVRYLDIPLGNLQSVAAVKYTTSDGVVHTWDAANYKLSRTYDDDSGPSDSGVGRINLAYGKSWPSETLDVGEPIEIEFVAGWADAASVPEDVKAAVELMAGHLWRHREGVTLGNTAVESKDLARGIDKLLEPYALAIPPELI